ncbi:RsmB/NOP family class I SAM-dependent RNA methyltransferase [Jatrophihabitans sp. YIM 134969]
MPDRARRVALDLLWAVRADDAYANLTLPTLLREAKLDTRDAAFATELGYGTLRAGGVLDEIVARCSNRPLDRLDPAVLDLLRLGAYQLLRTRVPPHAAVASTVDLARAGKSARASGFINAVLRQVGTKDWDAWTAQLANGRDPLAALAVRDAHPAWIAEAFARALHDATPFAETAAALTADDVRPVTHLVALPGLADRDALATAAGGEAAPWSPYGVRLDHGGDPGALPDVRAGRAAVQDEGSQLVAVALTRAPFDGPDLRWADLAAGPGGKTALLGAIARERGAHVVATELHPHRADLVRRRVAGLADTVTVEVGDARLLEDGGFDRVLLDAPCTGLGALRRRPEARWRRTPADVAPLVSLQGELLDAAVRVTRPGGVIAYVTCSPHPDETTGVVGKALTRHPGLTQLDARPAFPGVPDLGDGPHVQLWPHRHGTDAMFLALLRVAD